MSKKWIVKDVLDHVHGPYDTDEVLSQIDNGTLTGDEQISSYPEGSWKNISTEPEFFDHMLKVLSQDHKGTKKLLEEDEKEEKPLDDTVQLDESSEEDPESERSSDAEGAEAKDLKDIDEVRMENEAASSNNIEDYKENLSPISEDKKPELRSGFSQQSKAPAKVYREAKGRSHLFEDRQSLSIEKQAYLKKRVKQKERMQRILYLLFALAVGLSLSLFLIEDEGQQAKKDSQPVMNLKLPETDDSKFKVTSPEMKKKVFKKALLLLAFDEPKKTAQALSLMRAVLKVEPRNEKALLLSCNSNFQIWPHTAQDSKDLFVVSEFSKRAYSSGHTGDVLSTCRVVEKILYQKYQDAMQMTDSYLNAEEASGYLSFYLRYYKAYLLHLDGEDDAAVSFAESSVKLENAWIPSLILLGKIYLKLNRSQDAANAFTRVLKINSKHVEGLLLMAYLQFEYFSKPKRGFQFFNSAEAVIAERTFYDNEVYSKTLAAISKLFFKKGAFDKAREYARRAFDEDPSNIQAKNILISTGSKTNVDEADKLFMAEADQLFEEEEWKAAIALYEQAYMANKKNGLAALRMAQAYWKQSFVKDAIRWAELAISANPRRIQSYVVLSEFLISQYELIQAGRVLTKARAISKTTYEVYRGLAKIEYLRKNYPSAEKYARRALRIYSNDSESIMLLSQVLEAMGETEKAYAHAKAAMEVTKPTFELENYFALLLMRTRGLQTAFEYLETREQASGGNLMYRIMKANLYYADEQFSKSLQVSKQVYDLLEGENIHVVLAYARALGALDKIEAALDQYQKAFLMKPTDPDPLFEGAKLLIENKKPEGAIKQLERVQQVTPKYPDLYYYWGKAVQLIGEIKNSKKLLQESITLAEAEIERNPIHVDSFLLMADSYYKLGNLMRKQTQKTATDSPDYSEKYSSMISWYKLCSKSYQKAMDLASQPSGVYIDMARCQRLSGQIDLAMATAKRAEQIDYSNPRVWMEVGLIYEQQGNYRPALKAYEKYLVVFPNAPNKDSVLKKIEKLESLSGED